MTLLMLTLLIFFRPVYNRMAVELGRTSDLESSTEEKEVEFRGASSHKEQYNLTKNTEFISNL